MQLTVEFNVEVSETGKRFRLHVEDALSRHAKFSGNNPRTTAERAGNFVTQALLAEFLAEEIRVSA